MNNIHDNDINSISECNLVHGILNNSKYIKYYKKLKKSPIMVPLHHRTKFTELGENLPPFPPPTTKGGPHQKLREKMARR